MSITMAYRTIARKQMVINDFVKTTGEESLTIDQIDYLNKLKREIFTIVDQIKAMETSFEGVKDYFYDDRAFSYKVELMVFDNVTSKLDKSCPRAIGYVRVEDEIEKSTGLIFPGYTLDVPIEFDSWGSSKRVGQLEKLWSLMLKKREQLGTPFSVFNRVYNKKRIEAYVLRRKIFEVRLDRQRLGYAAKQKCKDCLEQSCAKCIINSVYKQGVQEEKKYTNKLLDIYSTFTNYLNREVANTTKYTKQRPRLGVWLRLKGYTTLLTEFSVWVRSKDCNKRKSNRAAREYLMDCRLGLATESTYYSCLVDEEVAFDIDTFKPRLLKKTSFVRNKREENRAEREHLSRHLVDSVSFWLAHERKERKNMLEMMSREERINTLKHYPAVKKYFGSRVTKWREELTARKYRVNEKKEKLNVKPEYRKLVNRVVSSKMTITSKRYVYSCDECAAHSVVSVKGHLQKMCWRRQCANFNKLCSKISGASIEKGSMIPYDLYLCKVDNEFNYTGTVQRVIGDFALKEVEGTLKYESSYAAVTHDRCGRVKGHSDIVSDQIFYKPQQSVVVNSSKYDLDQEVLTWYRRNNKIYYQFCKGFKSEDYLISGTPMYNSDKQLVSLVTTSCKGVYAVADSSIRYKSILANTQDYWSLLYGLSKANGKLLMVNFHSTRQIQNAANNASAIAEARIFTATAAGEMAAIKSKIGAVTDLQNLAEQKVATVVNRSTNINQVVRRRKNKRKPVVTNEVAIAIVFALACWCVSGQEFTPKQELAFLGAKINDMVPYSEISCNKFWEGYVNIKNRLASKYYDVSKDFNSITSLTYCVQAMGLSAETMTNNVKWLLRYNKYAAENGRDLEVASSIQACFKRQKAFDKILLQNNNGQANVEKKVDQVIKSLQNVKRDTGLEDKVDQVVKIIKKRDLNEQQNKIDADWIHYYGKKKQDVVNCLLPVTGNYNDSTAADLISKLEQNFTSVIKNLDYERENCRRIRIYYTSLQSCTMDNIFSYLHSKVSHECAAYARCKTSIREVSKLLEISYGKGITVPVVTHTTCANELAILEHKFKEIKLSGHYSGVQITAAQHSTCSENPNWKTDGWLAGISGSCVTGVVEESWRVRGCINMPTYNCINKPDSACHLAWSNIIHKDGKLLSNSHKNATKVKCCSLHCFSVEAVYESFTNQPMCSPCLLPYSAIFWTEQCLLQYPNHEVTSISITQSRTVFEVKDVGELVCNNAWHFNKCCGGKGPAPYNVVGTFKDKYCVCKQVTPTVMDVIWQKISVIRAQFLSPVHMALFFIVFLVFISMRGLGCFLMVLYFSWLLVSVEGACSVENLVPIDSTSHFKDHNGFFSQVKVKPGQCFTVGDATVEVVAIELVTIYNFLRVMPYHIKAVCQQFDWGCPLGKSDGVYAGESDCYANCVPGLRYQWKDSEYDWIGDKCFLNGRVATRYDVCFSYGLPNTFVELYTRVSGAPILKLKVKFHGLGFEAVGNIVTSNIGKDDPVTIIDVVSQPMFWPEMITYRLGKYLCSYHYVESSDTCNSGDIFKPTDIDPYCLSLAKKWDTAHGGYELTYKKSDFEDQLHNYFVDCGSNFEVDNNVTTMSYKQSIEWVEFKVIGSSFKFATAVPYCGDINKWEITSEPGLTYYHRRTKISFKNSGEKCKILFMIDGCISTNGNLIVLSSQDNIHIIEYWCGANSTGTAQIELLNGKVITKDFKVLNNFLPHKNSIRNSFEKIIRAASYSDFKTWISDLLSKVDFLGVFSMVSNWVSKIFSFNWIQIILCGAIIFVAYANFVRGNIMSVAVCLCLFWLLCFSGLVFAFKSTYTTGHIGIVDSLGNYFLKLVNIILFFSIDFTGLIVFCSKLLVSWVIWITEIMGFYTITRIEELVNKYVTLAVIATCYYSGGMWLVIVVFISMNARQIIDRCRVLSGCENVGVSYTNIITYLFTRSFHSVEEEDGEEMDDIFSTQDSPVDLSQLRVRQLFDYIKCGPSYIDPQNMVLPEEVKKYRFCAVKIDGVLHLCSYNGQITVAVMSHCLIGQDGPDQMIISGNDRHLLNYSYSDGRDLGRGDSGTPMLVVNKVKWFCGIKNDTQVFTDEFTLRTLNVTFSIVEHEFVNVVPIVQHLDLVSNLQDIKVPVSVFNNKVSVFTVGEAFVTHIFDGERAYLQFCGRMLKADLGYEANAFYTTASDLFVVKIDDISSDFEGVLTTRGIIYEDGVLRNYPIKTTNLTWSYEEDQNTEGDVVSRHGKVTRYYGKFPKLRELRFFRNINTLFETFDGSVLSSCTRVINAFILTRYTLVSKIGLNRRMRQDDCYCVVDVGAIKHVESMEVQMLDTGDLNDIENNNIYNILNYEYAAIDEASPTLIGFNFEITREMVDLAIAIERRARGVEVKCDKRLRLQDFVLPEVVRQNKYTVLAIDGIIVICAMEYGILKVGLHSSRVAGYNRTDNFMIFNEKSCILSTYYNGSARHLTDKDSGMPITCDNKVKWFYRRVAGQNLYATEYIVSKFNIMIGECNHRVLYEFNGIERERKINVSKLIVPIEALQSRYYVFEFDGVTIMHVFEDNKQWIQFYGGDIFNFVGLDNDTYYTTGPTFSYVIIPRDEIDKFSGIYTQFGLVDYTGKIISMLPCDKYSLEWSYAKTSNLWGSTLFTKGPVVLRNGIPIKSTGSAKYCYDGVIFDTTNGSVVDFCIATRNVFITSNDNSLSDNGQVVSGSQLLFEESIKQYKLVVAFEKYKFETDEQELMAIISSEEKYTDPFGYEYTILPTGLVSDICWPKHVMGKVGVEVCNDLMFRKRSTVISITSMKNNCVYTTYNDKRIRLSLVGNVWWPAEEPSKDERPIRLQLSRYFKCDEILLSGMLIFANDSCLFPGTYYPVSSITKSFIDDKGDRCYVVSSPGDQYHCFPWCNAVSSGVEKWPCASENESLHVKSYHVVSLKSGSVVQMLNSNRHAVHNLKHSSRLFPIFMQNHSPEEMRSLLKNSPLQVNTHFTEYIKSKKGDPEEVLCLKFMSNQYVTLAKLNCIQSKLATFFFENLMVLYSIHGSDMFVELAKISDIPVSPKPTLIPLSRMEFYPYINLVEVCSPSPWSKITIELVVEADVDKHSVEIDSVGNSVRIISGHDDILQKFKESYLSFVRVGERFITLTVTGSHLDDVMGSLQDALLQPMAMALCSCVIIRSDNLSWVKQQVVDMCVIDDTLIGCLFRKDWMDGNYSLQCVSDREEHYQNVKMWSRVISSPNWQMRKIDLSIGQKTEDIEQLGLVRVGEFLVGMLRNCVSRGSFFYYDGALVTNWHVTKGQSVIMSNNGFTLTYERPVYSNKVLDICMYGRKIEFDKVEVGEVVATFNPTNDFGLLYTVAKNATTLQGRGNASFLKLLPISIDATGVSKVIKVPFCRGMSGSPIINSRGRPVGIFGLGMMQQITSEGGSVTTAVSYSGTGELKLDNISFFDQCTKYLVKHERETSVYYYCNAPTGTGKTTILPAYLVHNHHSIKNSGCKILILQPNVTSVINCSNYLDKVVSSIKLSKEDCKVGYEVGLRNTVASNWVGGDRDTKSEIVIKTYGKNYESWQKMAEFDYILMDEIHVCKDPSVVSTIVRYQTNPSGFMRAKVLYLSATHLNVEGGEDIAQGETLSSSPRKIAMVSWTSCHEEASSPPLTTSLVISKAVIKCMPHHAIKIDTRYLTDGLVLFFCATKNDCDSGAAFASRFGIKSWSFHGDSSQQVFNEILDHDGNGWIFATDIIQQSVTLPRLKTVVDFMMECRPKVLIREAPLSYQCTIECRVVDTVTQVQRQGRVGRTSDGVYISGIAPIATRTVEDFVLPEVVLKLLDGEVVIKSVSCKDKVLEEKIRNLDWLSPSYMNQKVPKMITDLYKAGPFIDYGFKLGLTKNKDFDRVKWYLRPYFSVKEIDYYIGDVGRLILGDNLDSFWRDYKKCCLSLGNEDVRNLMEQNFVFTSFKDPFDKSLVKLDFVQDIAYGDIVGGPQVDLEEAAALTENNLPLIATTISGIALVYAVFEKLIDKYTSRIVTHVAAVQQSQAVASATYLAKREIKVQSNDSLSTWSIFKKVKKWVGENKEVIKRRIGKDPVVESSDNIDLILTWFDWLETQLAYYLGTPTGQGFLSATIAGGSLLGTLYRDIEDSVGRPMAMLITIACTGIVGFLIETKVAVVFSAAFFVSQVTRAIVSTFGRNFSSTNHAGTTWSGLLSIASGLAIGMAAKNVVISTTSSQTIKCINDSTLASASIVGQVGVPVLLVRHIYHIIKGKGDLESYLVAGASAGALLFECGPITVAYAAVLGAFVFVLECGCSIILDKYVNRDYSSPDGGSFLRRKKEILESVVSVMLNAASVIVYPQSLISIGIGALFAVLNGKELSAAIKESFLKNSGISPILCLISNIINFLRSDVTEMSIGTIFTSISTISSKVYSASVSCYFLLDMFKNAWETIKKFVKRMFDKFTGTIVKSVSSNVKQLVRESYWGKLMTSGEVSGEEPVIVLCRDPQVNEYAVNLLKSKGFTNCDRYWLKLDPGHASTNGSLRNNRLLDKLKKGGLEVSAGHSVQSSCPLSYFKITVGKLGLLVNDIVGSCEYSEDILSADIANKFMEAKVEFSITYDISEILAVIRVSIKGVETYWVLNVTQHAQGTLIRIFEYGPVGGMTMTALKVLSNAVGIDIDSKKSLDNEAIKAWDSMYVGPREKPMVSFNPLTTVIRAGTKAISTLLTPYIEKYTQPLYVYSGSQLATQFPNFGNNKYIRYWSGTFTAHIFNQIPFREKYYYDCDYHFPYGHNPAWLTESTLIPNTKDYQPLHHGIRAKENLNTVICVTTSVQFTKYTMALFALNNSTSIRYSYMTLNGDWTTEYTVDGGIDTHSKCYIHIVRLDTGDYCYKLFCSCKIEIEEIPDLEEHAKVLKKYSDNSTMTEFTDFEMFASLFESNPGSKKSNINPVIHQVSVLPSLLTFGEIGSVHELSDSLLKRIFSIFGLLDTTSSGFSNEFKTLDRLNFLLTSTQLQQSYVDYQDAPLFLTESNFVQGFIEPIKKKISNYEPYKRSSYKPTISPEVVMSLYRTISSTYTKSSRNETIYRKNRIRLPSNLLKGKDESVVTQSRAFYKMQQLYEYFPAFFDNNKVYLDPACGYGGFVQFLATIYGAKSPRVAYVSTLLTRSHRVPDVGKLSYKNFVTVSCMHPNLGDGNLRNTNTINNLFSIVGADKVDCLILDVGEFFDTSQKQLEWWIKKNDVSMVESICSLQQLLRKGGKMLLKWTGYFLNGHILLHKLIGKFKDLRVVKVGTSSLFSTEFYIYCSGFNSYNHTVDDIMQFYDVIGDQIYSQLCLAKNIWFNPKNYRDVERSDWVVPIDGVYKHYVQLDPLGKPPDMQYEFKTSGNVVSWSGNWDRRLDRFKLIANILHDRTMKKRLRFLSGTSYNFEKLYTIGRIQKRLPTYNRKECYNGLLSDMLWHSVKMTTPTSTIALTQVMEKQRIASIKKRLDVDCPIMTPGVADELRDIMQYLTSDYGKSLFGKLKFLDKIEVYEMLNKQGATSVISNTNDLQNFIDRNSDWYELCFKLCIDQWARGENSHCFFSVMHKNEPKKKGNVEGGKIILEKGKKSNYDLNEMVEELDEACNLNHRFIQYADEVTRMAHYIVIGSLIKHSNKQKLYKGTINGTPPYLAGNILRASWDMNSREKFFNKTEHHGFRVEKIKDMPIAEDTCGVIIDFSSLDITVTLAERMAEFDWCAQFYGHEHRQTLNKMFEEMAYAICVNQSGDIWLRAGQRGSGEIVTSLGNTLICIANIVRCLKRATGSTTEEVTDTVAKIHYKVGNREKTIQLMPYSIFGDGDDIVIITNSSVAKSFSKLCPEVLGEAGKVIRSGTKLGCTCVYNFHELEFCSHRYEPVLVGHMANYKHKLSDIMKSRDDLNYKIFHLPTRPTADVLGKLRATLKRETMFWNYDKGMSDRSIEVTRSKIMSYLLLYPHMRYVRILCIYALSMVGDGTINIQKFKRRYPEVDSSFGTISGALDSIYGVTTLDDISLRNYRSDSKDAETIAYNSSLGFNKVKINVRLFSDNLSEFIKRKKPVNPNLMTLDTKVFLRHSEYLAACD